MGIEAASAPRRGLTLGQKLGLLFAGLQVTVVASATLYLLHKEVDHLSLALQSRAETYARVVSPQVRSAVAFDDEETAREVFEALARDRDLKGIGLYASTGKPLHTWGALSSLAADAKGIRELRVFDLADRVLAASPVVSLEGPRGTLVLELSKDSLLRAHDESRSMSLIIGAGAAIVSITAALLIAGGLARRLGNMAAAARRVAQGHLNDEPLPVAPADELGSLARSFNGMVSQLNALFADVRHRAESEKQRLEVLVEERTSALARRNQDMRRLLDNVEQGFLTIDAEGTMSVEHSRIITTWFGEAPASMNLWEYMDLASPGLGPRLRVGWEQVMDGLLPLDVCLQQMPTRFDAGSRHFALGFSVVEGAERPDCTMVVISDVTAQIERERAEEMEQDTFRLFSKAMTDPTGVKEFLREAKQLVRAVVISGDDEGGCTRRELHTLKGNAAMLGAARLSRLCHELEEDLETGRCPDGSRTRLQECWDLIEERLSAFAKRADADVLMVDRSDYEFAVNALANDNDVSSVREAMRSWPLQPTAVVLHRVGAYVPALARRLGKQPVEVEIRDSGVRLEAEAWSDFWSVLPHVIRNAVDHGLETQEERRKLGKHELARISLSTRLHEGVLSVEIEDNGRGIDWNVIRQAAKAKGLPSASQRDLDNALFADGVSAKSEATEVSGRGVGMAALGQVTLARGGSIEVLSRPGQGTRVRITFTMTNTTLMDAVAVSSPRPIAAREAAIQ